jgi:hypothetical protein
MARSQAHLDHAVTAFERGDCATADQQALAGVRALASRPQPWEFIAYCAARRGDEHTAGGAITQAIRRDPEDARLHVNAALIDASFGRDPRPQLRQAKALDPHATVVDDLFDALKETPRAKWRRIGRLSDLVLQ